MERSQARHTASDSRPQPSRLVQVDLEQLTRRRIRKNPALRAKALRGLLGFLLLMALFTLLSRAADELTIPRVEVKEAEKRSIDRRIIASGKVEELSAFAVTTASGVRVSGISVNPGGRVEKDDPLFTLDQEDLKEKLEEAREELDKLDMDLRDQESRKSLDAEERAVALERANQDYADIQKNADKEVERAAKALEEAKSKLDSYAPPSAPDLSALKAACTEKEIALNEAGSDLAGLQREVEEKAGEARKAAEEAGEDPDGAEEALRAQYQPSLDAAAAKAEAARREKQKADEALAQAQAERSDGSQEQALRDAADSARQNYEQALENRESSLKAASRAVEDAQKTPAADSSGEKAQMVRDAQAKQVEKLAALLRSGGVVRACAAGTVTKLFVEVGSPTPDGAAVLLADGSKGAVFTAQVSADQEKYLAPGDEVVLKPGGKKEDVTGLVVESVGQNGEDPSMLDVAVRLPDGALEIGTTAEMEALRRSEEYSSCVPLSALHEENGFYYLLVPRETDGILGKETVAARLDVTVLEKNESYAALAEGALAPGQKFLAYSNKAVGAGDRIRLENP